VVGTDELKLELHYIQRHARYQRLAVPEGVLRVVSSFKQAPFPVLRGLLILIASLVVFRTWRRWARTGLGQIRGFIRSTWPRDITARGIANFVWYLDRVRGPLEWLALVLTLFSITNLPEIPEPKGVIRIGTVWILLAWFAVLLVDAFATRATSPWKLERSPIRLRSLGIVAVWLLVLGLGLHLALHLAGRATIFAWVFRVFQILAVPVALLLLRVWRPVIKEKIERETHFSERVAKAMRRRKGKFGFFETIVGMVFLLILGLRRLSLKLARKTALGRTLVAEALRQRMARGAQSEQPGDEQGTSIDAELRRRWLEGRFQVQSAIKDELEQAKNLVKRGFPFVGIVAERGGGKSAFLRRLLDEYGGEGIFITCPHGGALAAWASLCRALDLNEDAAEDEVKRTLEARAIRILAWDGVHRLAKPMLGGQAELDRMSRKIAGMNEGMTVITTIDSAAWQYLSRVREGRLAGAATIELPAWSEGQIGELIEQRSAELGIELSYHRLTFPRLLLEQDFDTPEEGVRASFRRILWSEADGNPYVAMRLLADALIVEPDGRFAVQLPNNPSPNELEGVKLVTLLALRFLLQSDGATSRDLVAGLRYSEPMIANALRTATMRGWIEEVDGHYRVTWKWYRTITRVLVRRNFLGSTRQRAEDDGATPGAGYGPNRAYQSYGTYGPSRPAPPRAYSYRRGVR
jgi:hypothetical protein